MCIRDRCLPEETNRRIVDVISDVNMCYSEFARKYLADSGLPKERTYQTACPIAEVLHMNLEKIQKSDVLERLGLEKDKYILLSDVYKRQIMDYRICNDTASS